MNDLRFALDYAEGDGSTERTVLHWYLYMERRVIDINQSRRSARLPPLSLVLLI